MQSRQTIVSSQPSPSSGKNAGKNKKKRDNKKKRVAAKSGGGASGTMTSQLGAGRATVPQSCKVDIDQVANYTGGFVWKLSDLEHAKRYLIMGAKDNGNYYMTTEQVSTECHASILRIIRTGDFQKLCGMLEEISVRGLAARQEPSLLSLAAAIVFAPTPEKKAMALALVPKCVRIPTHAFMLSGYVTDLSQCKPRTEKGKGWGSGFRKALGQFYTSRRGLELATAVTKYKNREGWRQEDLLRMLHINPTTLKDFGAQLVFKYVVACARGEKEFIRKLLTDIATAKTHHEAVQLIETPIPVLQNSKKAAKAQLNGVQQPTEKHQPAQQQQPSRDLIEVAVYLQAIMEMEACTSGDINKAIKLVRDHGLVREQIPTHLLNSSDIWTELLKSKGANGKGMPLEAMTRNLGKLSSLPNFMGQENTDTICRRLSSDEDIQHSRIHPFKVLIASRIYGMGRALKGALAWTVSSRVRDQLTTTFLRAFKNVTPTGKRYMVALDVSGSMSAMCMGSPSISCREASAALALVLYETEPHVYLRGFSAAHVPGAGFYNFNPYARHGMTLEQFIKATDAPFGATDCSLPMRRASEDNLNVDVFIVMTDSETYAGPIHPQVALENYRKDVNKPNAKLIVVGMTANCLTIADPNDRNTLNLAGFDASMPEIIAMFVRGEL